MLCYDIGLVSLLFQMPAHAVLEFLVPMLLLPSLALSPFFNSENFLFTCTTTALLLSMVCHFITMLIYTTQKNFFHGCTVLKLNTIGPQMELVIELPQNHLYASAVSQNEEYILHQGTTILVLKEGDSKPELKTLSQVCVSFALSAKMWAS